MPEERLISSYILYRFTDFADSHLFGDRVVKYENESNQLSFKAKRWREAVDANGMWRPVLLSAFLFHWRHRHAEAVALDELVCLVLAVFTSGKLYWRQDFLEKLAGEINAVGTHTACLSCVGVFAQLHCWAPYMQIKFAYVDWSEWRNKLIEVSECD